MHMDSDERTPPRTRVWDDAMTLAVEVYQATARFPAQERFGLTAQLRRAAISIVTNIAEGGARRGARQLRAFLDIAYGSTRECEVLVMLARTVGILTPAEESELQAHVAAVSKQLLGLLRALARKVRASSTAGLTR